MKVELNRAELGLLIGALHIAAGRLKSASKYYHNHQKLCDAEAMEKLQDKLNYLRPGSNVVPQKSRELV